MIAVTLVGLLAWAVVNYALSAQNVRNARRNVELAGEIVEARDALERKLARAEADALDAARLDWLAADVVRLEETRLHVVYSRPRPCLRAAIDERMALEHVPTPAESGPQVSFHWRRQ